MTSASSDGTPAGACLGKSGAGYFDNATHHRWNGSYSNGLGIAVTNILGESHTFTTPDYWGIWLNNRSASTGLCGLRLKPGDQLLLAPAPEKGTVFPIILTAPAHAKVGAPFAVTASYFKSSKGAATPLAHAKITRAGAPTDQHGAATVTAARPGKLILVASLKGYIRAEATVTVSK